MKVFFILNAFRRKKPLPASVVDQFRAILRQANVEHRIELSSSIDQARSLADEAINQGFDTLWVGGGDGTVNVLLNATFGSGLTYGVVPMGTINALARSFNIPLNPMRAARCLLDAQPHIMDAGEVNGTRFICFASIGFDAGVVHDVTTPLKKAYGRYAYIIKGVQAVLDMKRITPFRVEYPGGIGRNCSKSSRDPAAIDTGYSMILSNIGNYAGLRMFHEVQPCSGDMELFLFHKNRVDTIVGWAAASWFRSRSLKSCFPAVSHVLIPEMTVTSEKPMYLQLDGEAVTVGDSHHYHFKCIPNAIKLLVAGEQNG